MTRMIKTILCCLISLPALSQTGEPAGFAHFFLGTGTLYGGHFGSNLEIGQGNFSVYATAGFSVRRKFRNERIPFLSSSPSTGSDVDTSIITIPSSFNYALGARYRFNYIPRFNMVPRIGMQLGWIKNYYDDRILLNNYEPRVYGFSYHLGIEIQAPVLINIDAILVPKFGVLQAETHPYFPKFFVALNAGIGYPIHKLLPERKFRHIRRDPN